MSAVAEVPVSEPVGPQVTVRRSVRGAMAGGGTVSYDVEVDGRWIGWVGDERPWLGGRFGGRRWWACWREHDDRQARWNATEFATRDDAVQALVTAAGAR